MHRCGSTATWSPSARIAAVEQTSMHCVQPVLLRAAVRADRRLVREVLRLLEFAGHRRELGDRLRLRHGVGARREIALRRLVHARSAARAAGRARGRSVRRARSPGARSRSRRSRRTRRRTRGGRGSGRGRSGSSVDRVLGARADARIAARAKVEIDRVVLRPLRIERAEPAGRARVSVPVETGNVALGGQLGAGVAPVASTVTASWGARPSPSASAASSGPTISTWPCDS